VNIVITGSRLDGTIAAKMLQEWNANLGTRVFAEQKYPYSLRPNRIGYVPGWLPPDRIFAFSGEWSAPPRRINDLLEGPLNFCVPCT
jgi:hypothetical protein